MYPNHRPGDVVNGQVLTSSQGWQPIFTLPGAELQVDDWSALHGSAPGAEREASRLAKSIATYERVSGVAWIVIGVLQIAALVTIVAGIWNVFAGISRLKAAPHVERREHQVPEAFEGVGMLVAIGLVNLVFGALFGILMVAVDFYIRQRVLDNRHIFTNHGTA